MKRVYQFLGDLKENNERAWFQEHRKEYLEAKEVFEALVVRVIAGIAEFDPEIAGLEVKDVTYRIYRDLRFSSDKTPYKTHMGAYMVKGGKKNPGAGYYLHIEPGNSLLSGGIWCPEPALLKALRRDVYDNIEEFLSIIKHPDFAAWYALDGEKLVKVPAPFPKDSPAGEWVKYKSYTATTMLPDQLLEQEDALERILERFRPLIPFNRFLNYTLDVSLQGDHPETIIF